MTTVMTFLIFIPLLVTAARFWAGVARWLLRYGRTLGLRVQRARAAFANEAK
jgi:hypothetical protein